MGDHKNNIRSIAKAERQPFPPGAEIYGFELETKIEFTREAQAEITAATDAAAARGEDPRRALHMISQQWNPLQNPERFDLVVYNKISVGRPSPILPDTRQIPTAFLRISEHFRMPLVEVRKRASEAFDAAQKTEAQALQ